MQDRNADIRNDRSILNLISLSKKAGKNVSGEFAVEKSIKEKKAKLVIIANDASDNTRSNFKNMADYFNVPIVFFGQKEDLGRCIGKEIRASVAITDEGFAKSLIEKIAFADDRR